MIEIRKLGLLLVPTLALAAGGCSSGSSDQNSAAASPPAEPVLASSATRGGSPTAAVVMPDGRANMVQITDPKAAQDMMQHAVPLAHPVIVMSLNGTTYVVNPNQRMRGGKTMQDYFKRGADDMEGSSTPKKRHAGDTAVLMAMSPNGMMMERPMRDSAMAAAAARQGQPMDAPMVTLLIDGKFYTLNPEEHMADGQRMIDYLNRMTYGNFGS